MEYNKFDVLHNARILFSVDTPNKEQLEAAWTMMKMEYENKKVTEEIVRQRIAEICERTVQAALGIGQKISELCEHLYEDGDTIRKFEITTGEEFFTTNKELLAKYAERFSSHYEEYEMGFEVTGDEEYVVLGEKRYKLDGSMDVFIAMVEIAEIKGCNKILYSTKYYNEKLDEQCGEMINAIISYINRCKEKMQVQMWDDAFRKKEAEEKKLKFMIVTNNREEMRRYITALMRNNEVEYIDDPIIVRGEGRHLVIGGTEFMLYHAEDTKALSGVRGIRVNAFVNLSDNADWNRVVGVIPFTE